MMHSTSRYVLMCLILVMAGCGGGDAPPKADGGKDAGTPSTAGGTDGTGGAQAKVYTPSGLAGNKEDLLQTRVIVEGIITDISPGYKGTRGYLHLNDTADYDRDTVFPVALDEVDPAPWKTALPGQKVKVEGRITHGAFGEPKLLEVTGKSTVPEVDAAALTEAAAADETAFGKKYGQDLESATGKRQGFVIITGEIVKRDSTQDKVVLIVRGHDQWQIQCTLIEPWYDKPTQPGEKVRLMGKASTFTGDNWVMMSECVFLD